MSESMAAHRCGPSRIRRRGAAIVALGLVAGLAAAGLAGCSRDQAAAPAATTASTVDLAKQAKDLNEASHQIEGLEGSLGVGLTGCLQTSLAYATLMSEPLALLGGTADRGQIDQFKKDTAEVAAAIPVEVKPQFDTIAKAFTDYAETYSSVDFANVDALSDPATVARLQAASDELASPAVKQAQAEIDAYFARICPSLGSLPPAAGSR
ncbi:MAG: hypothetical protein U0Q07_19195 [Acidimicrobiales bacterium]